MRLLFLIIFLENWQFLIKIEDLYTPSINNSENSLLENQTSEDQNQLLKIVKDITNKGFVRNNYKKT